MISEYVCVCVHVCGRERDSVCVHVCATQYTHGDIYERRLYWLSKGSVSLKLWLLTSLQSLLDIWREAGS